MAARDWIKMCQKHLRSHQTPTDKLLVIQNFIEHFNYINSIMGRKESSNPKRGIRKAIGLISGMLLIEREIKAEWAHFISQFYIQSSCLMLINSIYIGEVPCSKWIQNFHAQHILTDIWDMIHRATPLFNLMVKCTKCCPSFKTDNRLHCGSGMRLSSILNKSNIYCKEKQISTTL